MNGRSEMRYVLWVVAGGYLLYIAWKLIQDPSGGPTDIRAFLFPVIFGVAGAVLVIMGLIKLKKNKK